jgi:CheY-like chemotaxis protein
MMPGLQPGSPKPGAGISVSGNSIAVAAPFRVLIVSSRLDAERYPTGLYSRSTAATTGDAVRLIERDRPALVVMDWDYEPVDRAAVCRAAQTFPMMTVMASLAHPEHAPAAIKAGCDAILLEPFVPQLAAARIARLSRQMMAPRGDTDPGPRGTNREWTRTTCPACAQIGVVSFEFSTRRRLWFACLACDHVWLSPPPC